MLFVNRRRQNTGTSCDCWELNWRFARWRSIMSGSVGGLFSDWSSLSCYKVMGWYCAHENDNGRAFLFKLKNCNNYFLRNNSLNVLYWLDKYMYVNISNKWMERKRCDQVWREKIERERKMFHYFMHMPGVLVNELW